jgi:phospholipid-transporting ATPase
MSVVVRFPDNRVKVLVKGADSSMLSILNPGTENELNNILQSKIRQATESHLTNYSSQGLRTLVLGSRNLNEIEFNEWQERYEEASTSIHDRTAKLRQAAVLIECDLTLLGATGIEDKLQEGVPEAIESLRQAGIKVWVLTGDKQETAISIGLSCRLLTQEMQQIIINGTSEGECRRLLLEAKERFLIRTGDGLENNVCMEGACDPKLAHINGDSPGFSAAPLALIIDGTSLVYILDKEMESEVCSSTLFPFFLFFAASIRVDCFHYNNICLS